MVLQRTKGMLRVFSRVTIGLDNVPRLPGRVCRKFDNLKFRRLLHHCQCTSPPKRIADPSNCPLRKREYNLTWCQIASFATNSEETSLPPETKSVNKAEEGSAKVETADEAPDGEEEEEKSLSVFQRFKRAYKEHGKVLIGVHVATSCVWFGSFFYAAHAGVDVIPLMEYIGLSDTIIKPFRNSSLGDVALAYLMYKLATPARYTVTLAGTNYMIKYLRHTGKMEPKQESFRELVKDSRTEMRERTDMLREKTDMLRSQLQQSKARQQNKDVTDSSKRNDSHIDR